MLSDSYFFLSSEKANNSSYQMLCIIYELDVSLDFFLIGLLKYILYITQSLMKDQLFIVTQKNVVLNLKKKLFGHLGQSSSHSSLW